MVSFIVLHPGVTANHVGDIPAWLDETDPRSAREQLDANYAFAGGWDPMPGFTMTDMTLHYPGDPDFTPIAIMRLRQEIVLIYRYSIIAILQTNGDFEVARMD